MGHTSMWKEEGEKNEKEKKNERKISEKVPKPENERKNECVEGLFLPLCEYINPL